jgi:hypothetical protein
LKPGQSDRKVALVKFITAVRCGGHEEASISAGRCISLRISHEDEGVYVERKNTQQKVLTTFIPFGNVGYVEFEPRE